MKPPVSSYNPMRGIALKVVSVAFFVAMAGLIKAAGQIPAGQIVFFRSIFAILPILVVLAWRHELRTAMRTERPLSHFIRGTVGTCGMALTFFALTRLPLPEAITLSYAQPLLVVAFSALFIGEVVRVYRWTAVAIGLVGVVIVSWPKLTLFSGEGTLGSDEAVGVLAAFAAAAVSAVAVLLIRRLVQTERTSTIVLWFSLTATLLSLLTVPFGWTMLDPWQASCLIVAGISGGIGQLLMTESYRNADASTIAPFEYTSLLLGIAVGYFAFGDLPTAYTIVGGLIVTGAGLFIIWRERALGLERGTARKVTPPQ